MGSSPQRLLTPYTEARHQLGGIGRTTLDGLVKDRKLTRVRIGRRAFVTTESLTELVESLGRDHADDRPGAGAA